MKKFLFIPLLFISFSISITQAAETNTTSLDAFQTFFERAFSGKIPKNAIRVPVLVFQVEAEKDILISKIDLTRKGLSSDKEIPDIWVETSDYQKTRKESFIDSQAVARFRTPVKIAKDTMKKFYVMANFNFAAPGGNTVRVSVTKIHTTPSSKHIIDAGKRASIARPKTKSVSKLFCKNRRCFRRAQ